MRNDQQEALFQRWCQDYAGLILKVVRACAETPHDRDDLFQDVLLNLWTSLPNFRCESRESTWIYRVAFNTALVWQRGEHRRHRRHATFLRQEAVEQSRAGRPDRDADTGLVERLYAAIRQLPRIDASLALMHLDGLTYREMAEVLGISENHVGVKLTRIRKQLADQLQEHRDEL